ncbi:uncharacterized protein LOC144361188 [Saccoglossus kowalevskii]
MGEFDGVSRHFDVDVVNFDTSQAQLHQHQLAEVKDCFERNADVFSKLYNDLGSYDLEKPRIRLTNDEPIRERHRRVPPVRYEELRQVLQGMIDSRVICESHSPWAAPIVMVIKKAQGCA